MTTSHVEHVGVVGAGTMGVGVSQLFAGGGLRVTLVDIDKSALDTARTRIELDAKVARMFPGAGAGAASVLDRIAFTTDLGELADAGFVVENVTENPELKREVYTELDTVCAPECLFGVNTSAIPITRIAGHTQRQERVIGTHFMNPAHLKPLVEVIRGFHTTQETVDATQALIAAIGKDSIVVNDSPGFVTNRVAMITVNEAICLLEEGVAEAAEIDRLFTQCFGHKMGPLATADLIGLDTVLYSLDVLLDNFHDPKFRPAQLLRRYVDAGLLGRKSGRGFFTYTQEQ